MLLIPCVLICMTVECFRIWKLQVINVAFVTDIKLPVHSAHCPLSYNIQLHVFVYCTCDVYDVHSVCVYDVCSLCMLRACYIWHACVTCLQHASDIHVTWVQYAFDVHVTTCICACNMHACDARVACSVLLQEQYYFVHKAVEFLFKEHLRLLTDQVCGCFTDMFITNSMRNRP